MANGLLKVMKMKNNLFIIFFIFFSSIVSSQSEINLYSSSLFKSNFFYIEDSKTCLKINFKRNKGFRIVDKIIFDDTKLKYKTKFRCGKLKSVTIDLKSLTESRILFQLLDKKKKSYELQIYLISKRIDIENFEEKEIYFDVSKPFLLFSTVRDCCIDFIIKHDKLSFKTTNYNVFTDKLYEIPLGTYDIVINGKKFKLIKK